MVFKLNIKKRECQEQKRHGNGFVSCQVRLSVKYPARFGMSDENKADYG